MITTNSDGQPISQAFVDAMAQPMVSYDMRLLVGGTDLGWTVVRASLDFGAGAAVSGYDDLELGAVYTTLLSARLWGVETPLVGRELEVRVGVDVDGAGTYEYVTVAWCTVTEASEWDGITTVSAVGRMGRMSTELGAAAGEVSATSLAQSISTASGVEVSLGAFESTDQTVTVTSSMTCREALAALALRLGGFAAERGDGVLVSPVTCAATYDLPSMVVTGVPELPEDEYEVDGLAVETADGTLTFGTGRVRVTDATATQETAAATWANVRDRAFQPGRVTVALADPRLTPFDVASLGDGRNLPTRGMSLTFDGGWFGTYSAAGLSEVSEASVVRSDVAGMALSARTAAEAAQAVALATSQHFWSVEEDPDNRWGGAGAHVTQVTQDEWGDSGAAGYHDGPNSLWNSLGMLFRDGLNNLLALVTGESPGVAIYDGEGNADENIVGLFTAALVRIGGKLADLGESTASVRFFEDEGSETKLAATHYVYDTSAGQDPTVSHDVLLQQTLNDGQLEHGSGRSSTASVGVFGEIYNDGDTWSETSEASLSAWGTDSSARVGVLARLVNTSSGLVRRIVRLMGDTLQVQYGTGSSATVRDYPMADVASLLTLMGDGGRETLYEATGISVYRWGRMIVVQLRGISATPGASTVLASGVLASYRPPYNLSAMVADASGQSHFARLWVNATNGNIGLASTGYATSSTWYGSVVYAY